MDAVQEKTFYDDAEICVTCSRLIVAGRTIPLEGVENVEQSIEEARAIGWPSVFMVLGVLGTLICLGRHEAGDAFLLLVGAGLSGAWMAATSVSYTVSVGNEAGRSAVIVSRDEQFARAVFVAISSAIERRHAGQ